MELVWGPEGDDQAKAGGTAERLQRRDSGDSRRHRWETVARYDRCFHLVAAEKPEVWWDIMDTPLLVGEVTTPMTIPDAGCLLPLQGIEYIAAQTIFSELCTVLSYFMLNVSPYHHGFHYSLAKIKL